MTEQSSLLRASIQTHRQTLFLELQRSHKDVQSAEILGAWIYALDTMLQQAQSRKICSWTVEGADDTQIDDSGDGDITLRRV